MKRLILAAIFGLGVSRTALADDMKVQQLVRMCNGEDRELKQPLMEKLICKTWIGGFLSAMIFADASATLRGLQKSNEICAPDDSVDKTSQLTDVLTKLSKDRPEIQHETARSVLFGLVRSLYSCKA